MFFRDIPGHQPIKERLAQAAESGRVAHAVLFLESPGSGGLALALSYIRLLLCQAPLDGDACGQCSSCSKNEKLIHPDVFFTFPIISPEKLSAAFLPEFREAVKSNPYLRYNDWMRIINKEGSSKQGNITADETRQIIKNLSLKSVEESYKIQVIWGAEYLGREGNVLLKILEEPPEKTVFLLIGQESDKILPTILSRTQMVSVPRFTEKETEEYLIHHEHMEAAAARNNALLSEGDLAEAIHLMQEEDQNFLEEVRTWLNASMGRNGKAWIDWADRFGQSGRENQKQFLKFFLKLLQRAIYRGQDFHAYPSGSEAEEALLQKLSERVSPESARLLTDGVNQAMAQIERNAHARLVLFNLSLNLRRAFTGKS